MILLTWLLASLAAAYVLTIVGLAAFQRRLQYFPDCRLTDLAQTGVSGNERREEGRFCRGEGRGLRRRRILKEVIRLRKQDQNEREERDTLLDIYLHAIETVPAPKAQAAE